MNFRFILAALALLAALPTNATVLYSNNFETNASGMSGAGFLEGAGGFAAYGFGASFLRNTAGGNPAASSILTVGAGGGTAATNLKFDLAILDSWDGDAGFNCCGPDFFNVKLDGTTIFSRTFNKFNGTPTTGPELTTLVYSPNTNLAGNASWGDAGYTVALNLGALSAGNHFIEFFASGSGWQAGDDESFAVDNIVVDGRLLPTNDVPEPGSLLLLGLGLAAAGYRRKAHGR